MHQLNHKALCNNKVIIMSFKILLSEGTHLVYGFVREKNTIDDSY